MRDAGATLWSKLRSRKVVQWGIAYAAGAWGLLQGLEYLSNTFHLPAALQQFATLGAIIGVPIVLALAWYHGDRGEQRVSGAELAIITLLFLIGGGIFWRYERATENAASGADTVAGAPASAGAPTGTPDIKAPPNSIAVLPFVNMSGDPANEYFSDGVSEEILNVLARTPGLQVAARTSSFSFKGQQREVPEIAKELHVRMVLEGSVRRQGDKVRITAQLVDAETGFHLWSENYDRELKDIFAIQDEIARAIGEQMKVQVSGIRAGSSAKPGASSVVAHDHYLRGLALWQTRREADLLKAIDEFSASIAADPGYAAAYGGLALTYQVLPDYSAKMSYVQADRYSNDAAQIALALDPALPEAYTALASLAERERRMTAALALYRRAIELGPSLATAHQWQGTALMGFGNPEAGLPSLERAAALDPRSIAIADNLAYLLMTLGRYQEALAVCAHALAIASNHSTCEYDMGLASLLLGRVREARDHFVRMAGSASPTAMDELQAIVEALEGHGDRGAVAARLASHPPQSFAVTGSGTIFEDAGTPVVLMLLGAPDRTLAFLESRTGDGSVLLAWAMMMPALDPIRCDPRFKAVAERLSMQDMRAAKICTPKTG